MARLLCVAFVALCVACCVWETNAQRRRNRSNCAIGSACNKCPQGQYKELQVGSRSLKVCCPNCGTYFRAGYLGAGNTKPFCVCDRVERIRGDCWKGDQCNTCLAGPNATYVGRINTIPICCAKCERSGMAIGSRFCNCLHNGP